MEKEELKQISCNYVTSTKLAILVKKKIKDKVIETWLPKKFAKIEKVKVRQVLHQSSAIVVSLPTWMYEDKFKSKTKI